MLTFGAAGSSRLKADPRRINPYVSSVPIPDPRGRPDRSFVDSAEEDEAVVRQRRHVLLAGRLLCSGCSPSLKGRCCINRNEVMAIPISRTSQTFTDTGMPRSDITFSADALIHASVFCCASTRAFMAHPMMRL